MKDDTNTNTIDNNYNLDKNKNISNKKTANNYILNDYENTSFKNIQLDDDLWKELNLPDDIMDKIKIRVKIEIKTFLREELLPILEKIIRRI